MICTPCQNAGRLNADANRVYDAESARYLVMRALEAHGACTRRCECQHYVGIFRNERRDG